MWVSLRHQSKKMNSTKHKYTGLVVLMTETVPLRVKFLPIFEWNSVITERKLPTRRGCRWGPRGARRPQSGLRRTTHLPWGPIQ